MTKLTLKLACKARKYTYLTPLGGGLPSLLKLSLGAFLIVFLIMFVSIPTWATETCAGGAGTLITGKDETTKYCISDVPMNWWSANAWCDAIGMKLFNVQTECAKFKRAGNLCAQLESAPRYASLWTRNVSSNAGAYAIYIADTFPISAAPRRTECRVVCQYD